MSITEKIIIIATPKEFIENCARRRKREDQQGLG